MNVVQGFRPFWVRNNAIDVNLLKQGLDNVFVVKKLILGMVEKVCFSFGKTFSSILHKKV